MKEAVDLMAAIRRLIDLQDETHEGYGDTAVALMEDGWFAYAAETFRAGHSYSLRAQTLRGELAELEARYGANGMGNL